MIISFLIATIRLEEMSYSFKLTFLSQQIAQCTAIHGTEWFETVAADSWFHVNFAGSDFLFCFFKSDIYNFFPLAMLIKKGDSRLILFLFNLFLILSSLYSFEIIIDNLVPQNCEFFLFSLSLRVHISIATFFSNSRHNKSNQIFIC